MKLALGFFQFWASLSSALHIFFQRQERIARIAIKKRQKRNRELSKKIPTGDKEALNELENDINNHFDVD